MTEAMIRGPPGLKSVKDLPIKQDGPPPGGFPSVRFGRRIPATGPTGMMLFGVYTAAAVYGFYKIGENNAERRALKQEKLTARQTLLPVLQAEEDRRYVLSRAKELEEEERLMKNVPGWKVGESVYSGGRWMPPAIATMPGYQMS